MDNCLIFQKLTNQEQVILSALDHITNEETVEEEQFDNANINDSSESDSEDSEED